MKHYSWMAVSALLLGFTMLNLTSCSKDEENGSTAPTEKEQGGKDDDGNKDSGKDDDKPVVVPDVVVTVDDSGQADGGHNFQIIDDNNFYIDGIKYSIEDDHLVVSGYDAVKFRDAAVIISTLNYQGRTMDVTSIKEYAFRDCKVMTSCVIGNKVTSIEFCAFYKCSGLTSVTIPSSVTSIEYNAFYGCSGLTSVHISDIAAWCAIDFSDYYSNPLPYAHHLYLNQKEITNLIIPDGMTSIGRSAFDGCSGLTSVTIPNSVTSIEVGAFRNCSGLTSLTIPNSLTSIGYEVFYGCRGLTSVTIPSSVTSIGDQAFDGCSGLTSVTIPSSVTSIGKNAFYGCSGLTSLIIPNSVTSIGIAAFNNCSGLTSITVENGNSKYDSRDNCNAIIETASNTLIAGCKNTTIPSSVTSIGVAAFYGCSGLTSVTIPSSVTSIERDAFSRCSGLRHVYCHAVNPPLAVSYSPFIDTPISSATLHVPAESLDAYKATSPWSEFGTIVAL